MTGPTTSGPLTGRHSVADRYDALVAAGAIEDDAAQRALLPQLDRVIDGLAEAGLAAKGRALGWLFAKHRAAAPTVHGLYVHGSVGRGKTMLMDLFFEAAPIADKRRAHFHEFMADVHERVFAHRQAVKAGTAKGDDPIPPVADALRREARLLCFDEFAVNDIADAMILGRLFTRLFADGVVLVATSNVAPSDLYRDGINRGHFLPFIELLKQNVDVVRLDARTDFRLEKLSDAPVYVTPLGDEADRALDRAWARIAGGPGHPEELLVKGRHVAVPQARNGAARFSFADLCEKPLGTQDYLKIAHSYHTIVLDHVPALDRDRRNEAKRFINLVDVFYDNRVKLVVSAAAEPGELYRSVSGVESFEFVRTASRLTEMRSHEYLALPHGAPGHAEAGADEIDDGGQ